MTQLETRYPCPVCIGAMLQKSVIVENPMLAIDHCPRCGGVWFDYGEVQQLRRCEPKVLWELVAQHTHVHQMQCHDCHTHLSRNDAKCAACGRVNTLDCPKCGRAMHTESFDQLRLDACRDCRGVWFDRHELHAIWKIELDAVMKKRGALAKAGHTTRDGGFVLLDALAWDPWLTYYGAHAIGHGASAAGELLGSAPGAVMGAGEVVAEAAASVFETIVEIIGGIFG